MMCVGVALGAWWVVGGAGASPWLLGLRGLRATVQEMPMLCEYQDAVERELIALCMELEDLIGDRGFEEVSKPAGRRGSAAARPQVRDVTIACAPFALCAGGWPDLFQEDGGGLLPLHGRGSGRQVGRWRAQGGCLVPRWHRRAALGADHDLCRHRSTRRAPRLRTRRHTRWYATPPVVRLLSGAPCHVRLTRSSRAVAGMLTGQEDSGG